MESTNTIPLMVGDQKIWGKLGELFNNLISEKKPHVNFNLFSWLRPLSQTLKIPQPTPQVSTQKFQFKLYGKRGGGNGKRGKTQ